MAILISFVYHEMPQNKLHLCTAKMHTDFFICYLAIQHLTLDHYQGDNLIHQMLVPNKNNPSNAN